MTTDKDTTPAMADLDEQIMTLAHRWATATYCKALNEPFEDFDMIQKEMRAALARRAVQPVAPVGDLWIHEDMDRDNAASALNAPRKDLKAAHTQSVEDVIYWRRRALAAEELAAQPAEGAGQAGQVAKLDPNQVQTIAERIRNTSDLAAQPQPEAKGSK